MIAFWVLGALSVVAIAATVRTVITDGYRRVPTRHR